MQEWYGAAGVCINEQGELLMVLQGKPEEEKTWSVPSGGKEPDETFEACCLREFEEETGYIAEIVKEMKVKKGRHDELDISMEVRYFSVKVIGGVMNIQDPDGLIHDIAWKTSEELTTLELSFPEDREFLINCLANLNRQMSEQG